MDLSVKSGQSVVNNLSFLSFISAGIRNATLLPSGRRTRGPQNEGVDEGDSKGDDERGFDYPPHAPIALYIEACGYKCGGWAVFAKNYNFSCSHHPLHIHRARHYQDRGSPLTKRYFVIDKALLCCPQSGTLSRALLEVASRDP